MSNIKQNSINLNKKERTKIKGNKPEDEQIHNNNNESFEYFEKDITVIEENNNQNCVDQINRSNYENQGDEIHNDILKIINEHSERFKLSKELFAEIKTISKETKNNSKRPNTANPITKNQTPMYQTNNTLSNETNLNAKNLKSTINNKSFNKEDRKNNEFKEENKFNRKRSYSKMSKDEQIRLRHLIPKKSVMTDYEKQENFQRNDRSKSKPNSVERKKSTERIPIEKHIESKTILKPFKKHSKEEKEVPIKTNYKGKNDYLEEYKSSNKNLKNYYDHIYLEKKGKFKLFSSDHPWVNDD